VLRTGPGYDVQGDPLVGLERELAEYKYVKIPEIPTFTGTLSPLMYHDLQLEPTKHLSVI
jgi:hypothetical protein